jgi:hypothetical protein
MDDLIGLDPCEGCKLPCPGSNYLTCIPRQRRDARRELLGVLKATGIHLDKDSKPDNMSDDESDAWIVQIHGPGHLIFIPESRP